MDPRVREQHEKAAQQGEAFERLTLHSDWPYYRSWLERARTGYETKVHDPNIRGDHIALARALEGYEAVDRLLTNLDKAIAGVAAHRNALEEDGA